MWIVLLKTKDQALQAFRIVKMAAEVESEAKLKALRTDRGGEFRSSEFTKFCEAHGIKRYLTAPYSPQQNGVVERRNQTVVAMARSMLKSKGMPGKFWGEAVNTAVYLLNRAPTKSVVGMTPYEAWYEHKPTVDHFRTFGCVAHVKTVSGHSSKFADRSTPMVFVGYEAGTKAYRTCNPSNNKVVVTRDVVFEEARSWNWNSAEPVYPGSDEIFHVVYNDSEHADNFDQPTTSATRSSDPNEEARRDTSNSSPASDSVPATDPGMSSTLAHATGDSQSMHAPPNSAAGTSGSHQNEEAQGSYPARLGLEPSSPRASPTKNDSAPGSQQSSSRVELEGPANNTAEAELSGSMSSPTALEERQMPPTPVRMRKVLDFYPKEALETINPVKINPRTRKTMSSKYRGAGEV